MQELPKPNQAQDSSIYIQAWEEVRREVLSFLDGMNDETFMKKPEDGSWSAAEIAEHLQLTQFAFARMLPVVLGGKFGVDLGARDVDYDDIFNKAGRAQGRKNPEPVTPSGTWDKQKSKDELDKAMARLKKSLTGKTADQLRSRGVEHIMGGMSNMLEWLWMLTIHENAHLVALREKFS